MDTKKAPKTVPWHVLIGYMNAKTVIFFISKEKGKIESKRQSLTDPESAAETRLINGNGNIPTLDIHCIEAGPNRGPALWNLQQSFQPLILSSVIYFYIRNLDKDKNQLNIFD